MNIELLEKSPTVSQGYAYYGSEPGGFTAFKLNPKSNTVHVSSLDGWYSCRELFLSESFKGKMNKFLFSHYGNKTHLYIKKFIAECEDRLGVRVSERSRILPTKNANVSIVIIGEWWRTVPIRKALFTILLRAGQAYNENRTFEQALYSNQYVRNTKYAVERFFNGFTILKGKNYGWVENFQYLSEKGVEKKLDKPTET